MNPVLASVKAQPDGVLYPKDAVLTLLEQALSGESLEKVVSPGEAAKRFGWSKSQWTRWFRDGAVEGAKLDESGRWRAPLQSVISHRDSVMRGPEARGVLRGPWKTASGGAAR